MLKMDCKSAVLSYKRQAGFILRQACKSNDKPGRVTDKPGSVTDRPLS